MPYSTDTRTLQPGDTYVAIRGERFDGHDFIPQAIEKGATAVVSEIDQSLGDGVEVILVDDTLEYLIDQAVEKIRHLDPKIVGITGSFGKTTTRIAVSAVLSEAFPVLASEGNRNTPLGLSLLVLNHEISPDTVLVLEMGARQEGDLRELCSYFTPTISVVTTVKGVHLETFGSLERIQREKSELVRALDETGTACLNGDDPVARSMAEVNRGQTLLFGTSEDCEVRPERITTELPILGAPGLYAALAAMSVGLSAGMSEEQINRGLSAIRPEPGRLNRLRGKNGSTLIDDTYNASPDTTLAALDVLGQQSGSRRIAFLGDMLELGEDEVNEHARVLRKAADSTDAVHAVGPIMAQAVETLPESQSRRITVHESSSDVAQAIKAGRYFDPQPDDVILVKGSQGLRMERISEVLLNPEVPAAKVLPRQTESWKQIA